ncbi:unnamed protein product [Aspergillus oryzae]|uniref:Unnamed protein product n=2 Tax=Aspergillus oryzae TaxID=5062 RepID=A0AAN4YX56_ASPOZ|nr:unnamed protein product [Aspergillus oryzae]GMF92981.1 unnamed protein product [Aspergillus oryzae]GMG15545.1 unnamed protein product [Aspergillus oryzae]GMG35870.1 unnamed protein product [Aspergillus oryzae]GMG41077.1 unnamed protein product [Aspergillus oryzae var. brunneus]
MNSERKQHTPRNSGIPTSTKATLIADAPAVVERSKAYPSRAGERMCLAVTQYPEAIQTLIDPSPSSPYLVELVV